MPMLKKLKMERELPLVKIRQVGDQSGSKELVGAVKEGVNVALPDQFKYGEDIQYAPSCHKEEVRIPAREKTAVGPKDKINIELEDDMVIDLKTALIEFDLTIETDETVGNGFTVDEPLTFEFQRQPPAFVITATQGVMFFRSPYTDKVSSVTVLMADNAATLKAKLEALPTFNDGPLDADDTPLGGNTATFAGALTTNPICEIAGPIVERFFTELGITTGGKLSSFFWVDAGETSWYPQPALDFAAAVPPPRWNFARLENGAWNAIKRLEIRWGSEESDDIREFNLLNCWQQFTQKDTRWEGISGKAMVGVGDSIWRAIKGKETQRYALPIFTTIFSESVVPLPYIHKLARLILHTDDQNDCLESNSTNTKNRPTFSISNVELLCTKYNLDTNPAFKSLYREAITSRVASVLYQTPYDFPSRIPANSTTFEIDITEKAKSMKELILIFRKQSEISGQQFNNKHQTFQRLNMSTWQAKFNTQLIPRETVEVNQNVESFWHYLLDLDEWAVCKGHEGTKGTNKFLSSLFYVCIPLETFRHQNMLSGLTTTDSHSQLRPQFRFSTPLPFDVNVTIYAVANTIFPYSESLKRIL